MGSIRLVEEDLGHGRDVVVSDVPQGEQPLASVSNPENPVQDQVDKT